MCGITGFYQLNGRCVSKNQLFYMSDMLAHRGPDDDGIYISITDSSKKIKMCAEEKGIVGLAHKRLSILDLSTRGHQPMSDSEGNIWITYNGEIYNFEEIKTLLFNKGYRFKSNTDTEVVIYAYKEWGIKESLKRFNGMFAFSLWDSSKKTLFLARDRIGIKPLYYYAKDGNFAFGSELKALLKYPYFEKEIDPETILLFLLLQYIAAPKTIFKNCYKLLPGHYLSINKNSEIQVEKYWDVINFLDSEQAEAKRSEEEYTESLEELLTDSVRDRMISDVPIGAFLSGGIDSSLVVSLMQKVSDKPIDTFSIGFKEEEFDEAPFAHKVADFLGTHHHELYLSPKDIQEVVPQLPDFYDEPFADSSAIPTFLVSKFARKKITVALSGDGGDELFCGYNRYVGIKKFAKYKPVPFGLRKLLFSSLERVPSTFFDRLYFKTFAHGFLKTDLFGEKMYKFSRAMQFKDTPEIYPLLVEVWGETDLKKLVKFTYSEEQISNNPFFSTYKNLFSREELNDLTRAMLIDVKVGLPDDMLTKVDRASMINSLEVRVPLLDHRIVEFATGLPIEFKWHQGERKYILKKILEKHIPKEYFERPKHGFGIPIRTWLKKDLKWLVDDYLNPYRIKKEGFFDENFVKEVVKVYQKNTNVWSMIWSLIVFEIWFEKYGK